jgi:hypothetical protein
MFGVGLVASPSVSKDPPSGIAPGRRSQERKMTPEAQGWLVAVFETEWVARSAAHKRSQTGTDPKAIRVGDPIDALTSIRGEIREETNELVGLPLGPQSGSAVGTVIGLRLAASAGTTLAVPDTEPARRGRPGRSGSTSSDPTGARSTR